MPKKPPLSQHGNEALELVESSFGKLTGSGFVLEKTDSAHLEELGVRTPTSSPESSHRAQGSTMGAQVDAQKPNALPERKQGGKIL